MKCLFFMLIPFVLTFAQTNNYPDSLTINSGKTYPCFVKSIDESSVEIIYLHNVPSKGELKSLKDITLEKLGMVYKKGSGFLIPLSTIKDFLATRKIEKYVDLNANRPGQAASPKSPVISGDITVKNDLQAAEAGMPVFPEESKTASVGKENRWSFGILYVPYYSGLIYSMSGTPSDYSADLYSSSTNYTLTEGEFSYLLQDKLRLILNIRYTSSGVEDRDESHARGGGVGYTQDFGSDKTKKVSLFNFDLGIKYYLVSLFNQKASAYVLAGIGRQFASVQNQYENLFPSGSAPLTESNQDEFLKDLNSPFHLQLGFGAEYFFNDYLALLSNIRLYYMSRSGHYDFRSSNGTSSTSGNVTRTETRDYSTTEINTFVGVGLNFYF